jgi:uncharacterized membrane protein
MFHPDNRKVMSLSAQTIMGFNIYAVVAVYVLPHFNCLMPELFWICSTFRDYRDVPIKLKDKFL